MASGSQVKKVENNKNRQREFNEFIRLPNMIFKTLGYDFLNDPKPFWENFLLWSYFALCFGSHAYNVFFMFKRIVEWDTTNGIDPRMIMRYGELVSYLITSSVKFTTFFAYRRRVRKLVEVLRKMYPSTEEERIKYEVNNYYWNRITGYTLLFYYVVISMMVIGPIFRSILVYANQVISYGSIEAKFPYIRCYPMAYGFNSNSFWGYMLTVVLEGTFSQYIVNINIGTDFWVVCLTAQINMYFDFISRNLSTYEPTENNTDNDCRFLAKLIHLHQKVFSLQKELDSIFGILLVYNLLATASTLCCVAFYAIIQGINWESIGYFFYFFTASGQFYMVCHYSHDMITKSENIATAAYEHTWYNGSIKYKKLLLIVMVRAQKAAALSANGFMVISLDTFKILMNITYRFFTVIRKMLK